MSSPFVSDVPADQATDAWRQACNDAGCPRRVAAVELGLAEALGRVTAAAVWARRSSPAHDSAAMDGIAVRAAATVGASDTTPLLLPPAAFEIIDTGDPMPAGRDAVVMREDVHHTDDGAWLRAAVPPGLHVRSIGEDVAATELLLSAGQRLRAVDVAAAGAAGHTRLTVHRQPVVAIVPTGDEIRPLGADLARGEIADTNSLMLAGQAREAGCLATVWPIQPDDPTVIGATVRDATAEADLVIVLAGSSAGRDDHTADVVAAVGTLAVHGVAVRPGHPVILGVVEATPVIGAPGYPVSASLTFDIFAAPLLAALEGSTPRRRPRITARLARKLASVIGMDDWIRVRLGEVNDQIVATPLPRGAGVLTSLVRADGLLVVPAGLEGHHAGEQVQIELLRDLDDISRTILAIGSHDLVLDLIASHLRASDPGLTLASANVGSLGGLVALRDGLCHLAGSHLLDPATGAYTLPYLDRVLPGEDLAVIRLVDRQQGLLVARGNPHRVTGLADLADSSLRMVNRQRGSGTRMLLDHLLAEQGMAPTTIEGYEREEHTHLAVAAVVASGRADCGMGIKAAAQAFDLDFVALAEEPYDLVMYAHSVNEPRLAPMLSLLNDPGFRSQVDALGGYSTADTGTRLR